MKKDKFQPIVMPCTKEQYESLIPIFKKHKIRYAHWVDDFKTVSNNHNNCKYLVGKSVHSINDKWHILMNRKVYQRFNRKIFLKSLGIIEEPEFVLPEKWCIKCNNIQELNLVTKYLYGYELKIDHQSYISKYGLNNHPGHSMYNFWNYPEINIEQFVKYVLKQESNLGLFEPSRLDIDNVQSYGILESQSVTNKQTKVMVKATVEESQPKEIIHKGCLVKWKDLIGLVTFTNNQNISIMSLSKGIGVMYTINTDIDNVSLFKGKLTLEQ